MEKMEEARTTKAVEDGQKLLDQGITTTARTLSTGIAHATSTLQEAYSGVLGVVREGQVYVDHGMQQYREAESAFFSTAKAALVWSIANPYISYPAAGAGTLLLFPFTRRLLYRQTLGRLQNPQSVVRSCEGRVKGIESKLEDYSKEVDKLQGRMAKAEEEYWSGLNKLKATRSELQRLSSALSKGERSAAGVLAELRTVSPKLEQVLQLRAEAAQHAATLRQQRHKVDKSVYKIAAMDI